MENYKGDVDIDFLKSQIAAARKSLQNIREEFNDEPDLLDIYEPSAIYLVDELEGELKHEKTQRSNIDFWISLDGEEFKGGRGPIGQVGTFLTRLNNATKQAVLVISEKVGRTFKTSDIPTFSLADTAVGSLKLGLKKPELKVPINMDHQVEFDEDHQLIDDWELKNHEEDMNLIMEAIEDTELPSKGMQLLVKAIASVNDDEILDELKKEYGSKQVIKILHYAKELAPSNRSPIEFVKFEGAGLDIPEKTLRTDKDTRKKLAEHARKLVPTTEYIEGTAFIGQADVTNQYLIARPLKYSNNSHDEIRCYFSKPLDPELIRSFLNKQVGIKGFIVYDRNKIQLLKLEVDDVWLLEKEEDE